MGQCSVCCCKEIEAKRYEKYSGPGEKERIKAKGARMSQKSLQKKNNHKFDSN